MRINLINGKNGYYWDYVLERKIEFTGTHEDHLEFAAFSIPRESGSNSHPLAKVDIISGKEPDRYKVEYEQVGQAGTKALVTFTDPPDAGEILEIRERYRSPHLNRIFSSRNAPPALRWRRKKFLSYDGLCVANRVEALDLRILFPNGYEIQDVSHIVSAYMNEPDAVHNSEVKRLADEKLVTIDKFNGETELRLRVTRPLYRYLYGFCWNPPAETTVSEWRENLTWDVSVS